MINRLAQKLEGLKPHTVTSYFGSFVRFEFGDMILTPEGKSKPEWLLLVLYCAWRIETATEVLLGCEDTREQLQEEVGMLENVAISSIIISAPSLDTTIRFENGMRMRLFPQHSSRESREQRDHWFLDFPDRTLLAIMSGNQWSYRKRRLL
jgi:hypothetical protein